MSNPFDDLKESDELDDDTDTTEPNASTDPEIDDEAEAEPKQDPGRTDDESSPSTASASGSASTSASASASTSDAASSASDGSASDGSASESASGRDASDESADGTVDEPASPAETGPAFEYSEVKQKPFYARTETVNDFENAIRTTIVPKLAEAEVLDEETREIHDAVLRLANERPERVAELVLEERRRSGTQ